MSDIKIIIIEISEWERNEGKFSIPKYIRESINFWKKEELSKDKIIVILNANTTVHKRKHNEEWIITITYDYKLIVKREILLEKIKIKPKEIPKFPEPIHIPQPIYTPEQRNMKYEIVPKW